MAVTTAPAVCRNLRQGIFVSLSGGSGGPCGGLCGCCCVELHLASIVARHLKSVLSTGRRHEESFEEDAIIGEVVSLPFERGVVDVSSGLSGATFDFCPVCGPIDSSSDNAR